ncbi:MAG: Unknown protein [uncultured Campylobacterales bacterium]|uniref:Uncharacterized protein n=1 Tax=uncultured Campylobacterales bacterium TaxID=352960 RepID=A0A6S6S1P6_9BACT|nr:MAG: Unknown protein [uncultured Campylobacterales bacterium]
MHSVYVLVIMIFLGCESIESTSSTNQAPIGINDHVTIEANTTNKQIFVLNNDYSENTLSISSLTQPTNGSANISATNILYTPTSGFTGSDSFTYRPFDGSLLGNITTVNIIVSSSSTSIAITHSVNSTYGLFKVNTDSVTNIDYTLNLGGFSKDIFFAYTNKENVISAPSTSKVLEKISTQKKSLTKKPQVKHFKNNLVLPKFTKVQGYQEKITPSYNTVGDSLKFSINSEDRTNTIDSRLKKSVTVHGITLNIWVDNNAYGSGCNEVDCITDTMIDYLSDSFLIPGNNNDIYELVTNIYGIEWGATSFGNLITDTNTIDILLFDINGDNATDTSGGVLGYYFAKDNYLTSSLPGSNEKIMFYIDSNFFASTLNSDLLTDDEVWSIDDYWPPIIISTLAHEFQHMIHFYQKTVLRGLTSTDTWINEMLSELTEDIIAWNINNPGPRGNISLDAGTPGNSNGRLPSFNSTPTDNAISNWTNSSLNYSTVYSFGAYLIRTYGGPSLLNAMLHNNFTDEQAITSAVGNGKSFNTLLQDWAMSILLSDKTNAPEGYKFNVNDTSFEYNYNGVDYKLGSINFFNYSPTPNLNDITGKKYSISFKQIASEETGSYQTSISKDEDTTIGIIAK